MIRVVAVGCCAIVLLLASMAVAAEPLNTNPKLAIQGYDVVAYVTIGNARLGSNAFAHEWQGATWFFVSEAHLELFKKNPEKYAPKYGGFCAWAAANDYFAPADPQVFYIHDGALYLNFNRKVQLNWFKDIPGAIKKADANWPDLETR